MADISKLKVNETTYDIKDSTARSELQTKVSEAPFDGAEYVRKNGSWALSSGAGGAGATSAIYFYNQTVNVANNAEILRITDSSITPYIVVLECTFANPSYITTDVTWTSYDGYISFTGTCTAATTANVTLGILADSKVNKSGDTMTGNLVLNKTAPQINLADDQISITTTSTGYLGNLIFRDKNYRTVGVVESQKINSYSTQLRIYNRAIDSNGNNTDNSLILRSDTNGTQSILVSSTTAWLNGIQAVSKAGDTITGDYAIKNLSMDSTITPVANIVSNLRFKDKNEVTVGVLRSGVNSTGRVTTDVLSHRIVNNTDYYNSLSICINDDGTPYVYMQHPSAWLTALGLGDSGWQSLTNSSVFTGTIYYRKIGDMIAVSGSISLASDLTSRSYVLLATWPSGYRPSKNFVLSCFVNTNSINNRVLALQITTTGEMYLYSNNEAVTTSYPIRFSGMGI